RVAAYIAEFITFTQQEDFVQALRLAEKLVLIRGDAEDWLKQGTCLYELKRYEEAIASYKKALVTNPVSDMAWYNLGLLILGTLDRLEEAISSFDKALTINPENENAWYFRGVTLAKLGRLEEAIDSFDKALTINPEYDSAWYFRGWILSYLGRLEEAIASYDQALAINPDYDYTWNNRGKILGYLDRSEEAIACFDKALAINPDYDDAWNNWGITLWKLGRLEEAIACFDKVLAINPDRKETWYYKGALLNLLGHYEEALISCNKAIELGVNDWGAFFSRAMAIMGLNWSEGITALEDAINRTKTKDKLFSGYTELIIYILFKSVQDSAVWKSRILPIIQLHENHQAVSELGQGIVKNIPTIMSEMVSDKAAQTWLEVWQEIVGDSKEFQIPLRLLKTAVEYKVKKGDRRVLLELPIEERKLLTEELKIEEVYKK
ncbi:MAG TPA: tetratricopeptide repeat protein, partial [Phormidium sp.]